MVLMAPRSASRAVLWMPRTQPCLCKADATRCHSSTPRVGAFLAVFRNVSGLVNTRRANLLADLGADWQTVDRWLTGIRRVFECACDDRTNGAGSGRRRRNQPGGRFNCFVARNAWRPFLPSPV